jgi:hypothetical protein
MTGGVTQSIKNVYTFIIQLADIQMYKMIGYHWNWEHVVHRLQHSSYCYCTDGMMSGCEWIKQMSRVEWGLARYIHNTGETGGVHSTGVLSRHTHSKY